MKPPDIKVPTQANTEYIKEGDVKELQCHAEGNPTPTYKWVKDGVELQQGVNEQTGLLTIQDFK